MAETLTNGRTTTDWRRADLAHHLHPFTDTGELSRSGGSRIITHADGVHVWDSDGRQFLDGMAGLWCVNLGYGRRELADAASRQMRELPYYNTFFKSAPPVSIALAEKLVELTPTGLDHAFFGVSGSDAVDSMVRLVRHYWNLKGAHRKKTIIGRVYGYHGSTMASASLGGTAAMHRQVDLPLPGFTHILPPYWYDFGGELDPDAFGLVAARALEQRIVELGADSVAAFVAEPVLGAGGAIVPPATYFPEIQRICRQHDVLLVADEVICGFGRTGHWFGSNHFDIKPDLLTLAKGVTSGYLPLSAVMVGDRVARTLIDTGGEFAHGYTYSGHPVCCAVALENIRILEAEGIIDRVREDTGPYLQSALREALADHPIVGEVRGIGMIGAIELVADRTARTRFPGNGKAGQICRDHCYDRGLILRAVRDALVFSPPLTITRGEIDMLVDRCKAAIDATAQDLGRIC